MNAWKSDQQNQDYERFRDWFSYQFMLSRVVKISHKKRLGTLKIKLHELQSLKQFLVTRHVEGIIENRKVSFLKDECVYFYQISNTINHNTILFCTVN